MKKKESLQILIPRLRHEKALTEFFSTLEQARDDKYFHPHPLTSEEAHKRCTYTGNDLYYVLIERTQVLGYGMLRGWDEGYEVPSLGVVIRASARGFGLAETLIHFLHTAARRRGARKVILRVYRENHAARRLYEKIGYTFEDSGDAQLRGSIDL